MFVYEVAHFKVVYIFQWENFLRLKVVVTLLVKSLSVFKHLMGRIKTTDIDYMT